MGSRDEVSWLGRGLSFVCEVPKCNEETGAGTAGLDPSSLSAVHADPMVRSIPQCPSAPQSMGRGHVNGHRLHGEQPGGGTASEEWSPGLLDKGARIQELQQRICTRKG